jgi:tetratricopeptide (TPR) repeat protein
VRVRRGWRAALLALGLHASSAWADLAGARAALDRGDYGAVEAALRTTRPAERSEADRVRARWLWETGQHEALTALATRMQRSPATRAEGLTWEAEALVAVGRYEDAVARWQRAIEATPRGEAWRARARAATWLAILGRRDEAREAANGLIDAYNDASAEGARGASAARLRDADFLTWVGVAARALGAVRDANGAFNDALRVAPGRAETNLEQAALMLTTEDYAPAGEALSAVLRANPRHPRALLLRARTRLSSDLDMARARDDLAAALAVNPRLTGAMAMQASLMLRDDDVAGAGRRLDEAAAINPRDLDVLTMRGVARFSEGDLPGLRRAFDALFAVAPSWAEGYEVLADFADWQHRYAEAATLMGEGLARPGIAGDRRAGARMRAFLGINLLRMGREDEALAELRRSFEQSRFNVRVANLLNFYEHTIPDSYVVEADGPFRIRYHREERAILRRFVPQLLHRAWDDMVRRYGFTPEGPISIELYADAEHFSVRTAGVPEIGVQGVCFGRVVTALSPRGGPFNWAQIVWHELAHVFAVQRSRSRVPRWFTEGLSEWEAFHTRTEWAREDDPSLYRALAGGRLPHVADFNSAFTHARQADDMLTAYYAASQLVAFLIERHGFERVAAMLPLWGEGVPTPEVISRALGVSADAVDEAFRAMLRVRLAPYDREYVVDAARYRDREAMVRAADERTGDAGAQADAAMALLVGGDPAGAARRAEAAIRLEGDQPVARWVRATLAIEARDGRAALAELDALRESGRDGYAVRMLEARAARLARDDGRALSALNAATRHDPSQVDAWRALAALHGRAHREAERVAALRMVVRLDQHDREGLSELLSALLEARAWADIRALAEHAVSLDPERLAVHLTLAQAAQELGDRDAAIAAYESALALDPPNAAEVRARIEAVRRGERGLPMLRAPAAPRAGATPPS